MRYAASALLVIAVYVIVTVVTAQNGVAQDPFLYRYVIEHFGEDTAARNAVAAILLNYRMYDTMFEALILLTAIIGMHQFLPGVADMESEGEPDHE